MWFLGGVWGLGDVWRKRERGGSRALIIERQELVETGRGHMGGGTHYFTTAHTLLYTHIHFHICFFYLLASEVHAVLRSGSYYGKGI